MDFTKQGTTSVKVHHAPGGKSNFSLAWDTEPVKTTAKPQPAKTSVLPLGTQNLNSQPQPTSDKTNVKIRNPPGGRSNIIFG